MKWIDFMNIYFPISSEKADDILLSETAYPFSGLRQTIKQVLSAIRAYKNKIKRCEMCGWKHPYHARGCQ